VAGNAPLREHAQLLRLLAEKVYFASLPSGKAVRDTSDFNEWLSTLAEQVETAETLEQFFAELR
jgi:hypothetical protein